VRLCTGPPQFTLQRKLPTPRQLPAAGPALTALKKKGAPAATRTRPPARGPAAARRRGRPARAWPPHARSAAAAAARRPPPPPAPGPAPARPPVKSRLGARERVVKVGGQPLSCEPMTHPCDQSGGALSLHRRAAVRRTACHCRRGPPARTGRRTHFGRRITVCTPRLYASTAVQEHTSLGAQQLLASANLCCNLRLCNCVQPGPRSHIARWFGHGRK